VPRSEGGWVLMSLDGVRVGPTPVPPEAVEPLPVNPDIADDAVAGHWDGTKMNTVYAVGTVLGLQVLRRPLLRLVQRTRLQPTDTRIAG